MKQQKEKQLCKCKILLSAKLGLFQVMEIHKAIRSNADDGVS